MAYLYRHIRQDINQPFYIGIGSNDDYRRANSKHGRNKIWNNIVKKSKTLLDIRNAFVKYLNLPVLYNFAISKNLIR